jgi:hypothetical protein
MWDSTPGPARIELFKRLRGELTLENPDGSFERLMSLCRGAAVALGLKVQPGVAEKMAAPAGMASGSKQGEGKRVSEGCRSQKGTLWFCVAVTLWSACRPHSASAGGHRTA